MAVERKFIEDAMSRYLIAEFLRKNLERVGFSGVTIQKTPMVTRINVEVANPGRLIGKKGRSIKRLTDTIAKEFHVVDPQIAVVPVDNIELEPQLMARFIARRIESEKPIRPTIHAALKKIIDAGAQGAEIIISGKIVAKGGKARSMRVAWGYLPKAGEVTRLVKKAFFTARPKYGAINVRVSITPPGVVFPDKTPDVKVAVPKVIRYADEGYPRKSEDSGSAPVPSTTTPAATFRKKPNYAKKPNYSK